MVSFFARQPNILQLHGYLERDQVEQTPILSGISMLSRNQTSSQYPSSPDPVFSAWEGDVFHWLTCS